MKLEWQDSDDLNSQSSGRSLLYYASMAHASNVVSHLCNIGANGLNQQVQRPETEWGERPFTPLMAAMVFADSATVDVLLHARADPSVEIPGGNAFMLACSYGRSENVEAWLSHFPDWNLEWKTNFGKR